MTDTSIPPESDESLPLIELRTPTEELGHGVEGLRGARLVPLPESMYAVTRHRPRRGSDVEAWLKRHRDGWAPHEGAGWQEAYRVLDELLDEYRQRADYALPLDATLEGTDGV